MEDEEEEEEEDRKKSERILSEEDPFEHPIGSYQRFQEYIRLVVSFQGSSALFSGYPDLQLQHLAPMIGTLIVAHKVEKEKRVHLYKIEDFEKDWSRLGEEAGVADMKDVYEVLKNNNKLREHPSSKDPFNSSFSGTMRTIHRYIHTYTLSHTHPHTYTPS